MKREIKFRAWDTSEYRFHHIVHMDSKDIFNYYKDFEITQWIGLKDKNGVDIYEGDIVLFRDIKHKVVFIDAENENKYHTHPDILYWGLGMKLKYLKER